MPASFCQLRLTCASEAEALKISQSLLEKRLVACVKQWPIRSDFVWRGKKQTSDEVLLEMTSRTDLFQQIEKEVKSLHSYDAFVLEATEISNLNPDAKKWLEDELTR